MEISFITTIYNEEKNISEFLDSLLNQTKLPDEIIIVDGGSSDKTLDIINHVIARRYDEAILSNKPSSFILWSIQLKNKKIIFKILLKKGNRSVGRNEAVNNASGEIITCSDSGNILDKHWLENITKPFLKKNVDVVAGYYQGKPANIFQKCLIPYVLVMPDKVDPGTFLPAARSIAFTKSIWEKVGGFDEKLSHNEDYVFAKKLKKTGTKIVFAKNAIVNWIPRNSYKEAFIMFFRFAFGDAEAGILRTNVIFLFVRYTFGLFLLYLFFLYKLQYVAFLMLVLLLLYFVWTVNKNYNYVKDIRAFYTLPQLQLTADIAVMSGTIAGTFIKYIHLKKLKSGVII